MGKNVSTNIVIDIDIINICIQYHIISSIVIVQYIIKTLAYTYTYTYVNRRIFVCTLHTR